MFLVGFQCFLALVVQKVVFPFFIVQIIGVVLLDMLHKGTVPVAQVLPPLVVVGYTVHHIINAERHFIVTGACKIRFVQPCDKGIGAG